MRNLHQNHYLGHEAGQRTEAHRPQTPRTDAPCPKVEHKEMKTLPVEQLASFLREAKDSGVFELYYVELATGLRGENC